jgi:hypothetical protein
MLKNKWRIFLFCLITLGVIFCNINCRKTVVVNGNPVSLATIKELAERYKPTVVFDENTLFYPIRFDGLKKIALEVDKEVIAELDITDDLKNASNQLNHPTELFDSAPKNSLIYYYSLSTNPDKWATEKAVNSFPDSLFLYVNVTFDKYLKITYTIPFEGNQWRNYHRGDGAMFALYFEEKAGVFQPIKARAYMHLQHSEVNYQKNVATTSQEENTPIFFVTSGSHSTYHRPGKYEDVDGILILKTSETAKNDYAYCRNRINLVFPDATHNNLEKWAFTGEVYWGGSPNDRIHGSDDFLGKIPLIRTLPLGNKSAKMSVDPSVVFDEKSYDNGVKNLGKVVVDCP